MKLFIFFSSLLAIATAAPLVDRALPPSVDPFYDPPSGWESQPVGSILKTRSVVTATASIVANLAIDGTQLLYRTAGPAGEALSTVVTILRPAGAKKDRLLAYTFAEDSNARKCAPSYNRQSGHGCASCQIAHKLIPEDALVQFASVPTNLITTVENFLVQAALAQGWTVTVPDYQGPNSAFIAGQLEGRAVLDGIRATLKYPNLNLNNPKIAVWVGACGVWYGCTGSMLIRSFSLIRVTLVEPPPQDGVCPRLQLLERCTRAKTIVHSRSSSAVLCTRVKYDRSSPRWHSSVPARNRPLHCKLSGLDSEAITSSFRTDISVI
jgi:hypothetical protein